MESLGAILVGLLALAEPNTIVFTTGPHSIRTRYQRIDYETACGSTVFRVRYNNGPREIGRVNQLLIDGRPVLNAAEILQIRAARRSIVRIEIMNCGTDPRLPVLQGVMQLGKAESQAASMRDTLFFRLTQEGTQGWRMTID